MPQPIAFLADLDPTSRAVTSVDITIGVSDGVSDGWMDRPFERAADTGRVSVEFRGKGHHDTARAFAVQLRSVAYPSGAAAYRALVRLLLAETGRCSTPSMFGFADDLLALDGVE